jgi:hypothetical protein
VNIHRVTRPGGKCHNSARHPSKIKAFAALNVTTPWAACHNSGALGEYSPASQEGERKEKRGRKEGENRAAVNIHRRFFQGASVSLACV